MISWGPHASSPLCGAALKSRVVQELGALIDKLAWNSHEVWAKERRAQGWRYGSKRDMRRKQHPMMLPYSRLSDKDKKWDRTTAEARRLTVISLFWVT
jgi:hypothetical protein